jgi:hypothetical protein
MSPSEKLKKLEALLLKQTGKSFDDFASVEEAVASLSFQLNNEQIMVNLLSSVSEDERRAIQMWRQLIPASVIATSTGSTASAVEQTVGASVSRLREAHFTKFAKGWVLDVTGEPISPDQPTEVSPQVAETRFQQWLLVLGLRHD